MDNKLAIERKGVGVIVQLRGQGGCNNREERGGGNSTVERTGRV